MKRFLCAAVPAAAIWAAGCSEQVERSLAARATPTELGVTFDSGMLFVQHEDQTMSAVMAAHAMHDLQMVITIGKLGSNQQATIPLTGLHLTFKELRGQPVDVTTLDDVLEQDDACLPRPIAGQANRFQFLPHLNLLHPLASGKRLLNATKANTSSRVDFSDGRFEILKAQGCWKLGNAHGYRPASSMVYGNGSVLFTGQTASATVTAVLTEIESSKVVKEVPIEAVGGRVLVRIEWIDSHPVHPSHGYKMHDFKRHYALLTPAIAVSDQYTPEAVGNQPAPMPFPTLPQWRGLPPPAPGRECGTAFLSLR